MESSDPTPRYVATPASGRGPGVIVLHAWWGLNSFFTSLCDRLAEAGFVAVAPDLYDGKLATTVEDAERLMKESDEALARTRVLQAVDWVQTQPQVQGDQVGVIGFSMGSGWAMQLSALRPDQIAAAVLFYGASDADFAAARAAYLAHFAEDDPWEPDEYVQPMVTAMRDAGRDVTLHTYAGAGHWFFEADRPDAYNPAAADLAWERTLTFLREKLPGQYGVGSIR